MAFGAHIATDLARTAGQAALSSHCSCRADYAARRASIRSIGKQLFGSTKAAVLARSWEKWRGLFVERRRLQGVALGIKQLFCARLVQTWRSQAADKKSR